MASTRKGGKKASKSGRPTKSSKAAKKALGASKSLAATKGGPGGEETHPPVIITDGSASLHAHTNTYRRDPPNGGTRVSEELRLVGVVTDKFHSDTGSSDCITLSPGETAEVTVTCRIGGGGNERSFTVRGGNSNLPEHSPVIVFNHGVFPQGVLDSRGRRIFRSQGRDITRMEIVTSTGRTHDCSVVREETHYTITIVDAHVIEH